MYPLQGSSLADKDVPFIVLEMLSHLLSLVCKHLECSLLCNVKILTTLRGFIHCLNTAYHINYSVLSVIYSQSSILVKNINTAFCEGCRRAKAYASMNQKLIPE